VSVDPHRPPDPRRLLERRSEGIFLKLADPATADLAVRHFDFLVVDREHSQLSEAQALALLTHADLLGAPALLRLPELDRGQVNRALEAGAAGIQLSTVTTPAQVTELREQLEYAPGGRRSISLGHRRGGYGTIGLDEYLEGSRGRALAVVQVETALDPEAYAAIAAAGPDAIFIGTQDLLVDCGLDRGRQAAKIEAIAAAAAAAGVPLGGFGLGSRPDIKLSIAAGDSSLLAAAMRDAAASARKEERG
jgi:4-hydroxy-2-oxoheptanedioate aldolase